PPARRKMTLLDAILLVASAAVGMGAFQYAVRTWFPGWIWTWAHGIPDRRDLTTWLVIVTCCDFVVFLVPLISPWTVLLLSLTLTSPRPRLRRAFRRPGVAACAAALFRLGLERARADPGAGRSGIGPAEESHQPGRMGAEIPGR